MTTISPDSFAMICFLVLMQNNGLMDKSPVYIIEKKDLLRSGFDAFLYLDIYNMRKVKAYCDAWHIEMPEKCAEELTLQEEALKELQAKGFEF
jgi:hypothetical protein